MQLPFDSMDVRFINGETWESTQDRGRVLVGGGLDGATSVEDEEDEGRV